MAEFDFDAARRWARFDPQKTLARRGDNELPFGNANLIGGQGLLLDTCVYIDQMQDRSPQTLDDLIAQRQVNHSTVAIQELMYTVGVLNPSDARSAGVLAEIGKQIKAMPPHRIFVPDIEVLGRAALLSGILCRLQGYDKEAKLRALQDCVLFLQARKLGLVVLTANVGDYDMLLQLIPAGRALFYRRKMRPQPKAAPNLVTHPCDR
jgi:predicted nucleic acid-binding protein